MRALLALAIVVALPVTAAPRDFSFTWTTRTSAAGTDGFEAWLTPRLVRFDETYARLEPRVAWVAGVAKGLEAQTSIDFDVESTLLSAQVDPRLSSLWRWTTWRPGAPFSMGGLGRLSGGPGFFEAEGRLLADLEVGRVLVSLNVSAARALFWNGRSGVDTHLEELFGLRVSVSSTASLGLEARARSGWRERVYAGTALYVGPTLTFTNPRFWVSVGGGVQVAADKAQADRELEEPNELRDNERYVLRLALGVNP